MVLGQLIFRGLKQVLQIFFVGLNKQQLEISAFGSLFESGRVKLSDLLFRRELLDRLPFPLRLSMGFVGRIEITGLENVVTGGTTVISIENVHLVLAPQHEDDGAATDAERWRLLLDLATQFFNPYGGESDFLQGFVRDVLQMLPPARGAKHAGAADPKAAGLSGAAAKWVPRVIERAEIQLKNVHVRVEVPRQRSRRPAAPSACDAIGLLVPLVALQSVKDRERGAPAGGASGRAQATISKRAVLSSAQVYCDYDSEAYFDDDAATDLSLIHI